MTSNKSYLLLGFILLSIGIFYIATIRDGHDWGGDFSMYIHHAKNIAQGIDYQNTGYIYNPSFPYWGPKIYPPIFPILLSPLYYLYGLNLTAMKIEIILIFLISLLIIFQLFKNELSFKYALIIVSIIGFNPYLWDFKDNILSDIPFLFFLYSCLLLIQRRSHPSALIKTQPAYAVLVGLSIYFSIGTRTIGVVLIPCLLMADYIKFNKLNRFTTIAVATSILLIILQGLILPGNSSYLDQFFLNPETILHNLDRYTESLFVIWANGYSKNLALSVIISGLAMIGYLTRIKEGITVFELFPVFYLTAIIFWPSFQETRFLIPIIPLYVFYAFVGIYKNDFFKQKRIKNATLTIMILSILFSYAGKYSRLDYGPIVEGIDKKETIDLFNYIKKNTNIKDVFIFLKPRVLALYTNRCASVYHWPRDKKHLFKYFDKISADYLIARKFYEGDLHSFVNKYRDNFKLVYSNPDFYVYKIVSYRY